MNQQAFLLPNTGRNITETTSVQKEISSIQQQEILADYELLIQSRVASNHIRRDVLSGKAKFGMENAGKELLQIVLGKYFKKGDFYSGYYRDQTFMMKMSLASIQDLFASLYADTQNDKFSGGRQMNGHFATPFTTENGHLLPLVNQYNVTSSVSALGGHISRALGVALASKKFKKQQIISDQSNAGAEVSFCILGDATTSEGIFFESVNAACVLQIPLVFIVQDDGYGISVPVEYQTAKGSISKALAGFQRQHPNEKACEIYPVNGWDYEAFQTTFAEAVAMARENHVPCVVHVKQLTQGNGHSTSGSHERYKSKERLTWEQEKDCLVQFEEWIIDNNWATLAELEAIQKTANEICKKEKQAAWIAYQAPFKNALSEIKELITDLINQHPTLPHLQEVNKELTTFTKGEISHLLELAEQVFYNWNASDNQVLKPLHQWYTQYKKQLETSYQTELYSNTESSALKVAVHTPEYASGTPEMINGHEILNHYFDQLFENNDSVYAFGQDVGKIGGVNQAYVGLQKKYGEDRIYDTGIREWTIVGQAIGMAMRGLRPIGEIQYLDYLVYALPALTDDLATLRWRTKGMQKAPAIIRTRGHRLEGVWHSGSPMSMLLGSLRGIYLLTPRNMTQAVGMYNTMLQSDDPAIIIEPLNGYRKKEQLPTNLSSFTVPLGSPEILKEGKDITLVTYGACVAVASEAVAQLSKHNISVELIDVQTLLPFDLEHQIGASLKKTNRVIFLDEDVPGGGTAYMMQKVLDEQDGYHLLDSKPIIISAKAHRPPYGDNGNYVSKPQVFDIVSAAIRLMEETRPSEFKTVANLFGS